jgi:hypothetical protein
MNGSKHMKLNTHVIQLVDGCKYNIHTRQTIEEWKQTMFDSNFLLAPFAFRNKQKKWTMHQTPFIVINATHIVQMQTSNIGVEFNESLFEKDGRFDFASRLEEYNKLAETTTKCIGDVNNPTFFFTTKC